jgi:pimeloyl-ACP methyl ester carboxylesterase
MKLIHLCLAVSLAAVALPAADPKPAPKQQPAKKSGPALPPNPKKLNPPPGIPIPEAVRAELTTGANALGREIAALQGSLRTKPQLLELLPDVQIFHNAVRYALEDGIFYRTNEFATARQLLKLGNERAQQLRAGQSPWATATGPVVRGYVSKLDGSVQPYGLIVPASFKPGGKPLRLDFWLHGRGDTLSEINFLEGRLKGSSEFTPADAFVLHPYGRFMNAFKFAGEVDVWESLEHAAKHYPIDRDRLAMRGFSMGGAGAWHLGAHHPDKWAAVNPGAGFVDVKNYQRLGDKLDTIPWWEQKLWNLYDPLACPINLVNTTLVAYSGEEDSQKAAADLMEAGLAKEGVKMTHIIGPKTGHKYEPEAKKKVAALVDAAVAKGRSPLPRKVSFVTHSLKWSGPQRIGILGLEEHWKVARVDKEVVGPKHLKLMTQNVNDLLLTTGILPDRSYKVTIDGAELSLGAVAEDVFNSQVCILRLRKEDAKWSIVHSKYDAGLVKRPNLQGPIDDAFMDSFVFVRPTGQPLNPQIGQWVDTELKEATFWWRRYFRGEARVKSDSAITDDDIKNHNLILWGDPSSNRLLARIADKLPIQWTAQGIKVGGKSYDATKHAPVLIYPNPLNPSRYVVLNSGFTFPQQAAASNSLQTPKLPDWAILDLGVPLMERVNGKGVVDANFFGERWELVGK